MYADVLIVGLVTAGLFSLSFGVVYVALCRWIKDTGP